MKKILYASILLNVTLIVLFVGKRIYYSNSGSVSGGGNSFANSWNAGRTDALQAFRIDSGDVVFVGTSITEGFPLSEIFGNKIKNRGISLNTSNHLIKRIVPIAAAQPSKIFIEIGINDIQGDVPQDSTMKNIATLVKIIRGTSPKSEVYISSVFPTCCNYFMLEPRVEALNVALQDFCQDSHVRYIDVHSRLVKGKGIDSLYTYDGLHLNGAGYRIWESCVDSLVK